MFTDANRREDAQASNEENDLYAVVNVAVPSTSTLECKDLLFVLPQSCQAVSEPNRVRPRFRRIHHVLMRVNFPNTTSVLSTPTTYKGSSGVLQAIFSSVTVR